MTEFSNILSLFIYKHESSFHILTWLLLSIGLIQNFIYAVQLPSAWAELRTHSQADDSESSWQLLISDVAPPITLIVPAYNEEMTIKENIISMLSLRYPDIEIIVVNDGSKDCTLQILIDTFQLKPSIRAYNLSIACSPIKNIYRSKLYPRLIVVDKINGGSKADASNAGINIARSPLFCIVDADSLLEIESLLTSVRPFMENPKTMVAVGGTIRILNGCIVKNGQVVSMQLPKKFLPLVQYMEYIRAFLMCRLAWSHWGMLSIISGAFGIFQRELAIKVGGFSNDTVGEDYELVIKLHRHMLENKITYAMRYVPEPVCWTEAPDTLKGLGVQRKRWQRGALDVFFKHKDMFLNYKFGKIGLLGFTNNFIIDVLGPIVELLGHFLIPIFWFLGILNIKFIFAYMAIFFLFGIFISVCTLIIEEMELKRVASGRELALLALIAIVENFGYRQLSNIWRLTGWWEFLCNKKGWGKMTRRGFTTTNHTK